MSGSIIEVATPLIRSSAWQMMTATRKGEKTIIRDGSSIAVLSAYKKYEEQDRRDAFDRNTPKHLQSGYCPVQFPHHFLTPDGSKGFKRTRAITLQLMPIFQGPGG